MPGTPGEQAAFIRGETAGNISARLADHDRHFEAINGSIRKLANGVEELNLSVQRIFDVIQSNEKKIIATADALKEAEEARRDNIELRWSPFAKIMTVVGSVLALFSLGLGVYIAFKGGG
jgi:hypothetical protein